MTAVLGPNGLPLKSTMPAAVDNASGWFVQSLNQDSNRWSDATDDAHYGCLRSYEEIYGSQPAVFTAVNKIARRIATLPFEGFVHGNALVVKVRLGGPETPPDMLVAVDVAEAVGVRRGRVARSWDGQRRSSAARNAGSTRRTSSTSRGNPRTTGHRHQPAGGARGTTVRLEDATQRYQTAQFRNGNRPSLAVSSTSNPRRELFDYARERVEAMHKGADNAGKTFFTGREHALTPMSMTPVEAALIDQRQLNREEVGMVYDLAGPLMNDLTHGTLLERRGAPEEPCTGTSCRRGRR
jgi:hypothetical protein